MSFFCSPEGFPKPKLVSVFLNPISELRGAQSNPKLKPGGVLSKFYKRICSATEVLMNPETKLE
jgi:hypothetical protein